MMDDKEKEPDLKGRGITSHEALKKAIGRIAILRFALERSESVDFIRLVPDVLRGAGEILDVTLTQLEEVKQVLENLLEEYRRTRAKARHYEALVRAGRIPEEYSYEHIREKYIARLKEAQKGNPQ